MQKQSGLFEQAPPLEAGTPVFCHEEFLVKMNELGANAVGKRASLLLHRLLIDERRQHYKSTRGANRGWRRSRLGGNQGSHFYAWWAPKGAPPLKDQPGFSDTPEGAVFIRAIRHHDDHTPLNPHSPFTHYLPIAARDLRAGALTPEPWTPNQSRFASARQKIRILKGHPGSGKTTALWNAVEAGAGRSALYVTYSRDLAALALAHFRRFAPGDRSFRVMTFADFVRELNGSSVPCVPERESRVRFVKELASLPPRVLGPWADQRRALYDEVHAHLVGAALPAQIGRFGPCSSPRLPDRTYREQRRPFLGGDACDALTEVMGTLLRREGQEFLERHFPELMLAWRAATGFNGDLADKLAARKLLDVDCIAIDEVQDLTPLEAWVLVQFAWNVRRRNGQAVSLLAAGDEAQTVRPTDFEWGWFQDLVHFRLDTPMEFKLGANLRSPRRIAALVNASWELYSTVAKQDRPGGTGSAEIDEDASDQILYCSAAAGEKLDELLDVLAAREGLALVNLADEVPAWVPQRLRPSVLTVTEAKGLDFHSVCVLNPGRQLETITRDTGRLNRSHMVEPLTRRLAIDRLRVAISRPTERLYFLDVNPSPAEMELSRRFLNRAGRDADIGPVIPEVVLKTLEEELLDPEERVRLCETDARQFVDVKPDLAWTRARQAVALLGSPPSPHRITDEPVRRSAYLTLAQVCFCLAFRKARLSPELGNPDLYREAAEGASRAGRDDLQRVFLAVQLLDTLQGLPSAAEPALAGFETLEAHASAIEPWLMSELAPRGPVWIRALESSATQFQWATRALARLEFAYRFFQTPDAAGRLAATREQAVAAMIASGFPGIAAHILEKAPESDPKLFAQCLEAQREHLRAAEAFAKLGMRKDAIRNYRAIPDAARALEVAREMEDYTAAPSLQWMVELDAVLKKRPDNLLRVATEAEKKHLQSLLESHLPGARRVPVKRRPKPKA